MEEDLVRESAGNSFSYQGIMLFTLFGEEPKKKLTDPPNGVYCSRLVPFGG